MQRSTSKAGFFRRPGVTQSSQGRKGCKWHIGNSSHCCHSPLGSAAVESSMLQIRTDQRTRCARRRCRRRLAVGAGAAHLGRRGPAVMYITLEIGRDIRSVMHLHTVTNMRACLIKCPYAAFQIGAQLVCVYQGRRVCKCVCVCV